MATKRGVKERLSHPLDAAVKTLYSPHPRCKELRREPDQQQPNTEEFIVQRQGHIANRSLPVKGQCAFVRTAFGKAAAVVTMNERHPIKSQRPVGSLGDEDGMHPGKGGA
ncbi:hypothetical protein [Piscinibacter sp. XHJ-5]|uniref:hypothetical protein n=1 Tax=Piscinibacter sp. XHJ-5 TaxID=3037797 RepID=UPI0024534DC8|nr:hypothetical protein [Piscinibacter sp. XHJ-5]